MKISHLLHKRNLFLLAIIIIATLTISSDALYQKIENIMQYTESIIYQFPIYGMLLFTILAIISAMLAFYSSAILVPIGIYAWGATGCFVLLLIGWILGGILSFLIGYSFGRTLAIKLIGNSQFAHLENYIGQHAKFIHILLFQAALPSEVPGYLLGALRYHFPHYLLALVIAELPYAIGTVFLGTSFLQRNITLILLLGVIAIIISTYLHSLFRKNIKLNNKS